MNPPRTQHPKPSTFLRRTGLACILVAVCARVVTTTDPLPGWSLDPFTTIAPHNGLGPAASITLAALACFGLALVLTAAWRAGERVPGALLLLGGLGLLPIAWHGWLGPTACVENASTGLVWAAAIAGALAACIACRHRAERSLVTACCAALAGPLAIRAAIQVYSEHPVLVAGFEANREAFLASHGWTPDSALGRSFERRLSQPDASAWFAMSNVYASVMAGCVAVSAAACLAAIRARLWKTGRRNDLYRAVAVFAGLACALGGLFIALPAGGSLPKGAAAAMLLGLGVLALGVRSTRSTNRSADASNRGAGTRNRGAGTSNRGAGFPARALGILKQRGLSLLGPALLALALLAVLLRGLLGEHLGELSLLFRAYYLQAAARIFADSPLLGVGPDGFQSAYLLAKNPLSPEEVSSPHSIFFDYASTLGLFGLAWCGLLVTLAARAGGNLFRATANRARSASEEPTLPAETPPATQTNPPYRWLVAIILCCTLLSFLVETLPLASAVPDAFSLVLLDGLTKLLAWSLLWLGLGAALLSLGDSPLLRVGLVAAALAILTHAQIELTATDLAACGWALLLLGTAAAADQTLACASGSDRPSLACVRGSIENSSLARGAPYRANTGSAAKPARRRVPRLCAPCGAVLAGLLAVAALVAALPVRSWESELRRTSDLAAESTTFIQRATALSADPPTIPATDHPALFLDDLAAALGRPIPATPEGINTALADLRLARVTEAADRLDTLARSTSTPSRALTHTAIRVRDAEAITRSSTDPTQPLTQAIDLAAWATDRWPTDSRAWRDLAQALHQAARLAPDSGLAEPFADLEPLRRAAELDPYSPQLAHQLALRHAAAQNTEQASLWAARALANHDLRRLDPLAGLSENHLLSVRELLVNP